MALSHHSPQYMTVEEYFALDDSSGVRYEYIDGEVTMMSGGSLRHADISNNIVTLLKARLRGGPCRAYNSDVRVQISKTQYVFPDISVTCNAEDRDDDVVMKFPRVLVEVLSPSTELTDRVKKLRIYQQCPTVQEYILVSTTRPLVEIHRREKNGFWSYRSFGPDEEIVLVSLDVRFPIADIYHDVRFPTNGNDDGDQPA
jgi:Uma2 family endonuclease